MVTASSVFSDEPIKRSLPSREFSIIILVTSKVPERCSEIIPFVERGTSMLECRTHNQESPGSIPPFATVSKFGHFRSLHNAPIHLAVSMGCEVCSLETHYTICEDFGV